MERRTALGIDPGHKDSAASYLASLKSELAHDKAARKQAQDEVETIGCAVGDLKKTTDKFAAQVPALEEKILDGLKELRDKELSLEQSTKAKEDYRSQNASLTKKLESKLLSPLPPGSYNLNYKYIYY
jgi:predicted  nucleic acid-binding Zn-ribbon protein